MEIVYLIAFWLFMALFVICVAYDSINIVRGNDTSENSTIGWGMVSFGTAMLMLLPIGGINVGYEWFVIGIGVPLVLIGLTYSIITQLLPVLSTKKRR